MICSSIVKNLIDDNICSSITNIRMMADPRFVLAVSLIITQAAQACIPLPPQEPTTAAPTTAINPSGEIQSCNTRGHQPVSLQSPILTPPSIAAHFHLRIYLFIYFIQIVS